MTVSLHVSFVLAEYLRGNVLPAEQHVASDLSCILHPDSHFKALMELHYQRTLIDFFYQQQNWDESDFSFCLLEGHLLIQATNSTGTVLIKALTVNMLGNF